jgi:predicted ArsR family transcriptional regulator
MANRGRPSQFATSKAKVEALNNLHDLTRYHILQLVDMGLVNIEEIKTGGRGRPVHNYVVSGKGRGLQALARNWK